MAKVTRVRPPNGKVLIYTMDYCPYCTAAKKLLQARGVDFEEVYVPEEDDATWDALYQLSRMRTMPQIFDREGKLIGGYSQLASLDAQDQLASLK